MSGSIEQDKKSNGDANPLAGAFLSFVGVGVMAEAIIAGLLRKALVAPDQIVGSHPRQARREELYTKYGVPMVESNREAVLLAHPAENGIGQAGSTIILAIKPQRLSKVLSELKGALHQDQLVISIVAGAKTEIIANELLHPAVVRAMPNTPAQIGEGMTAWTATSAVSEAQREDVRKIFAAMGKEAYVPEERYLDMVTALSGSGPGYVFL